MPRKSILASNDRITAFERWFVHTLHGLMTLALVVALFGPATFAMAAGIFALSLSLLLLFISVHYGTKAIAEMKEQAVNLEIARTASTQIEELFAMTDMLQAAEEHEDAGAVLMATALRLLPQFGGALYVLNNSRDRLDLAKSWNEGEHFRPTETLLPGNCWALKRGKPHINSPAVKTLCCTHSFGEVSTLEVPMMARGSVYGLLQIATEGEDGFRQLMGIRRLGRALADSMSLALSNIALREKLRTQSLRDPLTGLYNRRYMEDALERFVSLAERTGGATSVIMIDLDNFKHLNDAHGHAKGDAVLRDVASQLISGLRPSDVVSRYGGEELMVILPDCGLADAEHKAEHLRLRIEALSEQHGVPISGSFGVSCIPETSTSVADIVPMADAALYAAKQAGKNCVRSAERRSPSREDAQLRLAMG